MSKEENLKFYDEETEEEILSVDITGSDEFMNKVFKDGSKEFSEVISDTLVKYGYNPKTNTKNS